MGQWFRDKKVYADLGMGPALQVLGAGWGKGISPNTNTFLIIFTRYVL